MESGTYYSLSAFKLNYLTDFENSGIESYREYLEGLRQLYRETSEGLEQNEEDFLGEEGRNRMMYNIEINQTLLQGFVKDNPEIDPNTNEKKLLSEVCKANWYAIYMFWQVNTEEIIQFINSELIRLKISSITSSEPSDSSANDYSGKNELSPKEKLIVLDKLGIINFLTGKLDYSDNATHLAEILGAITGIDNQKGTLTGYCNYLIRSEPTHRNSPYYSYKTKERANEIYNKFKIKDKAN
ncbi:hypothetical protein [Chryseobacterium salivictor]|nr:hypothetical protein [Chryseobacterium salivictor]